MIEFELVRYKNFLSTGNIFTEIPLNQTQSTLIVGKNGQGKSSMIDAITFSLFGKAFRKINKPSLVNSINQSNCVVEIEFTIGSKKYKVIRGIKPNVFEIFCNGTLVNQDAKSKDYQDHLEKNILRLNYKSFTQVVILGSASFTPFMQLSASDRRAVIEDLLDIQIFSSMNNIVKDKLSEIKETYTNIKYSIDLTKEKITLQRQNIEEHKTNNQQIISNKQKEINDSQEQISKLQSDVELIQKHIDILQSKIVDNLEVTKKKQKLIVFEGKVETSIKKNKKDIDFYKENDSCPTCKQDIDNEFKERQIETKLNKANELQEGYDKLSEEIEKLTSRLNIIEDIKTNIVDHQSEIVRINSSIIAMKNYVKKIIKEISEISDKHNSIEDDNEKLKELNEEIIRLNEEHEQILIDKKYYDLSASLLKDGGIKTKIIKQYLPIMNKLINKYLSELEFFVNFNINENFEETIKSRHRDDFTYSNFSEGEKMRIDLSLIFAWRQIAKMKNSVNTNLLIFDEIMDSSLDNGGTDVFLQLIKNIDKSTNVIVISHKGDQLLEKFDSVLRFEKVKNFSKMQVVQ